MRDAWNRLIVGVLLAAVVVVAALATVEATALAIGRDGQLGSIDYRGAWDAMLDWDPGESARTAIFAGVAAIGLVLLLVQVLPRRRRRTVEIGRGPGSVVNLRADRVAPAVARRLEREPWIGRAEASVRIAGDAADVTARPRTLRPHDPDELVHATDAVKDELTRLGLQPGVIEVAPREPSSKVR